jgi:hypothetical protein
MSYKHCCRELGFGFVIKRYSFYPFLLVKGCFLYGWFPKTIFVNIHYQWTFSKVKATFHKGVDSFASEASYFTIHQDLPFLNGLFFKFSRWARLFVWMHLISELAEIMSIWGWKEIFTSVVPGGSLSPLKREGNYWNPATPSPPSGNTLVLGCYPREKALCRVIEDCG